MKVSWDYIAEIIALVILIILCAGEPDLLDMIIKRIGECN